MHTVHCETRLGDQTDRVRLPTAVLTALAVVACACVGCGSRAGYVTVDNTSADPMTVFVDGQSVAEVPAGSFRTISLEPGAHQFEIRSQGNEIFSEHRTIEPSNSIMVGKKYVLNPTASCDYAVCNIVYGTDVYFNHPKEKDPTKRQFLELRERAEPMPGGCWFELPYDMIYVLREGPEVAHSRESYSLKHVLTRISKHDHNQLRETRSIQNPTQEDLQSLALVVNRVHESMSLLEPSS